MISIFTLAMISPSRQKAFRRAVVVHLLLVAAGAGVCLRFDPANAVPIFGHLLLVAGIVEGATLVGWRLTQLPKSQALEFLLASPLLPSRVFLEEAVTGLARLGLITLAGLPMLIILVAAGRLEAIDVAPLLLMPWTWGAITGLGLTMWAYEAVPVRKWGERVLFVLILFYLVVGILAGEHLPRWLAFLPKQVSDTFLYSFRAMHEYNPFAILQKWLDPSIPAGTYLEECLGLEAAALAILGLLLTRAAMRFKAHFHDRHYRPVTERLRWRGAGPGNRPLAWWAVRRVLEYSGRVNLYLAGGFGILYGLYVVAGSNWPPWLGRIVFVMVDIGGGVPAITTALVVLAAVPAAFQYGLWDSNAQDRCKRLELLLMTDLQAFDYWEAAAAAAWRRGRGYLLVALWLWLAALLAGRMNLLQAAATVLASLGLWAFYFAVGFRAFSRGLQANGLGSLLTLGLPFLVYALHLAGWPALGALLPPGSVYYAAAASPTWLWLLGPVLAALATVYLVRQSLRRCDGELRLWYDRHHGRKVME